MIIIYKINIEESKKIITISVLQSLEKDDIISFSSEIKRVTAKYNTILFTLIINLSELKQVSSAASSGFPDLIKLCQQNHFKKIIVIHEKLRKEHLILFLSGKVSLDNVIVFSSLEDALKKI